MPEIALAKVDREAPLDGAAPSPRAWAGASARSPAWPARPLLSHGLTLDDVNRGFELMAAQDGIRSVIRFA